MSTQAEGRIAASAGQLYWRAWKPSGPARALLVLAHGYAEHIGRYEHVAGFFQGRGFIFYAFDQAGHGKSDGRRGHVNAFGDYISDLKRFVAFAQEREPRLPTFLLGHSQGGLVSLAYGVGQPTELRGIVVSGPALRLAMPVPAWKLNLGKALSGVVPTLAMPNGIPSDFLTHDPLISGAYARQDPLVFKVATARWATEFFRAQTETLAAAPRLTLPCLLLHGGDDRIASPEGTRQFFAAAGASDKTLKIYDGFYHEIFNEIGKEQVLADVAQWLEKHL
jgi:alpha-beta hydrolase superfamily lysophospholipase